MAECDHNQNPNDCWWERDIKGIHLCKVCSVCEKEKLSKYDPSVLSEDQQITAFGRVVAASNYSAVEDQVESDY